MTAFPRLDTQHRIVFHGLEFFDGRVSSLGSGYATQSFSLILGYPLARWYYCLGMHGVRKKCFEEGVLLRSDGIGVVTLQGLLHDTKSSLTPR
jgi:hypothetical protein